ncbi:MAG: nucleotidyltransferase family protein [Candidatus Riflebacteria bacterium]|nr:nucleotidyltransferase family protein [Candidatus Riflebacteria bacterium]
MNIVNGGFNLDLASQKAALQAIVQDSDLLRAMLERAGALRLPNWYVGAGCVTQSVWNHLCGFPPLHGIKDVDLVYFDSSACTLDSGRQREEAVRAALHDLSVEIDCTNQAAVHLCPGSVVRGALRLLDPPRVWRLLFVIR